MVGAMNITLEVKQTEQARRVGLILPTYAREGDAGIDLRSVENLMVRPKARALVGTGLHITIPAGFMGLLKDRSGLASQFGIHTMAGVVDSNYRGEVKVVLLNTGEEDYLVNINDRIAQLVILPVANVQIKEVKILTKTGRDEAGWGSTGKK